MTNSNKLADALPNERDFEQWYVENAFLYERSPIGSRDCGLMRKAWHAALAANPAPAADHADYVLVPRVPTDAMNTAYTVAKYNGPKPTMIPDLWAAMLAAAPHRAPAPVQVVGVAELGAKGFTIARFKEADVPLGTKLYTAHPPAPAADGAGELPEALRQFDDIASILADSPFLGATGIKPTPEEQHDVMVEVGRMLRRLRPAIAALRQPVPDAAHIANEWADMATNGIQWLRNLRDGISTATEALREMESNLTRIRALIASRQESRND